MIAGGSTRRGSWHWQRERMVTGALRISVAAMMSTLQRTPDGP